jgi:hypothetical protein
MSNFYDDSKFGVIERKWFGLTAKHGGETAAGFTFNETEATKLTRWYPRGPITIKKVGVKTLGTLGKGEEVLVLFKSGTTRIAAVTASTTSAPYTIASNVTPSSANVAAGSYLNILASTNVCSTGTVAVFVDFVRRFSSSGKWDS